MAKNIMNKINDIMNAADAKGFEIETLNRFRLCENDIELMMDMIKITDS